jgi:hypothetical protein
VHVRPRESSHGDAWQLTHLAMCSSMKMTNADFVHDRSLNFKHVACWAASADAGGGRSSSSEAAAAPPASSRGIVTVILTQVILIEIHETSKIANKLVTFSNSN